MRPVREITLPAYAITVTSTSVDAAMHDCFDELILPSILPETNTDSDLDTMLAAVSPVHHHDLALSSYCRPKSPSASSSSPISFSHELEFDIDMAFQGDDEAARRLMCPTSHQAYYSQAPGIPPQQMRGYHSQQPSFSTQQSWMSVPLYTQQQNPYDNNLPPNNIYPSFDASPFSSGSVIPPTPQATEGPSFFNPPLSQPGYLSTTPISNTPSHSSSHESNATSIASSLSRSCSPSPLTRTAPPTDYCKILSSSTPQPTQGTVPHHHSLQSHTQAQLPSPSNSNSNSLYSYSIPNQSTSPQTPPPPPAAHQHQLQISSSSLSSTSNSLHSYGIPVVSTSLSPTAPQTWRCAYPNCTSRALFTRGCDLRKHYNRHSKHLFCRVRGCPQSAPRIHDGSSSSNGNGNGFVGGGGADASRLGGLGIGLAGLGVVGGGVGALGGGGSGGAGGLGGFSSKKDRARHEAKHNPKILCEWVGEGGERCGRKFSRVDNMKDHVRRIHRKGQQVGTVSSGSGAVGRDEGAAAAAAAAAGTGMVHHRQRQSVDLGVGSDRVATLEDLAVEEQWVGENELHGVDIDVGLEINRSMVIRNS